MKSRLAGLGIASAMLALPFPAAAIDGEWGDITLKGVSKFTIGGGVRTQDRHSNDLGKLNTPGQQTLCQADDCVSFTGDPAPNQRLLAAAGGHFMHANDDGDMNYNFGDFYTGIAKLNSEWTLNWGEWTFRTAFVGYFDEVNAGFDTIRFNTVSCTGANPSQGCTTPDSNGFDRYNLGPNER